MFFAQAFSGWVLQTVLDSQFSRCSRSYLQLPVSNLLGVAYLECRHSRSTRISFSPTNLTFSAYALTSKDKTVCNAGHGSFLVLDITKNANVVGVQVGWRPSVPGVPSRGSNLKQVPGLL